MHEKPISTTRDELLRAPRLQPAPARPAENDAILQAAPPGSLTVDQYLALRQVPEHRRAGRRAFAGALRIATVDEFDRLFAGVRGPA